MAPVCKTLLRLARRLGRDCGGVSAVEFALIAPVMIAILFGSVEVSLALIADRKVTQTASTVADLVAQDDAITAGEMADIFTAASAIMQPYDTAPLQMRISSVVMAPNKKIYVDWSQGKNMSARKSGSSVTVPKGLLQPNSSIIMAEVSYDYTPTLGNFLKAPIGLGDTFYLRPRRSLKVKGP